MQQNLKPVNDRWSSSLMAAPRAIGGGDEERLQALVAVRVGGGMR